LSETQASVLDRAFLVDVRRGRFEVIPVAEDVIVRSVGMGPPAPAARRRRGPAGERASRARGGPRNQRGRSVRPTPPSRGGRGGFRAAACRVSPTLYTQRHRPSHVHRKARGEKASASSPLPARLTTG
jgi:hypothetical protein